MKNAFTAALVLALGLSLNTVNAVAWAAQASKLPLPRLETLPNGLEVAWLVNDELPIIDLLLLVKSGSRDDPAGKSGTASLLASSLDRGVAGMTARQIAKAVEMLGASRFASADDESFSIGMHGLAPDGATLLDLLSKLVMKPEFPVSEVQREQRQLLERWSHVGDYGDLVSTLAYQRLLTAGTPYGRGSFASIQEFKNVGREDVVNYYRRHFTPKNSVLMVVGRAHPVEFRKKIIEAFGKWEGELPQKEKRTYSDARLKFKKKQILLIDRPNLNQAYVRIGFKAPLITAPDHYALTVTNALLGEYFNSRLNSLIRDKLGLTYSIGSAFTYSREMGGFTISSATKNESIGPLIQKTLEVLRSLKAGPIPANEVQQAKMYLEGGFPLGTATLSAVASRWLGGRVLGLGPDYLNEYIPQVDAVTTEAVVQAIAKNFDLEQLMIVVTGDSKAIKSGLAGIKGWNVQTTSLQNLM